MFDKSRDCFASLGHRMWGKPDLCNLIDRVHDLPRWKNATEPIGNLLGRLRRHGHANKIRVATDGQVIWHDFKQCTNLFAASRQPILYRYAFERPQEDGKI